MNNAKLAPFSGGAATLVLIFISVSFLGRLGVEGSLLYPLFIIYCSFYIFFEVMRGRAVKLNNEFMFAFHVLLIFYLLVAYFFSHMGGGNEAGLVDSWRQESVLAYFSIVLAQLIIIISRDDKVLLALNIIRFFSYIVVVESFLFFVLPDSLNMFRSDLEAGFRFNSLLLNSYLMTGLFLLIGYVVHLFYLRGMSRGRMLMSFFIFLFAILQTKDRSMILSYMIVNLIVLYKEFSCSYYTMNRKKKLIIVFSLLFFVVSLPYYYMTYISDRDDILSFKSSLVRAVLVYRSFEVFENVLPVGGGPGSQVRLMFDDSIPTDVLDSDFGILDDLFSDDMLVEKRYLVAHMGTGRTMSPHNTYMDHLVSLGLLGVVMVAAILIIQLRALINTFKKCNCSMYHMDAFFVASIIIVSYTSFINSLWLFVLMYRSYSVFGIRIGYR